jgi:ABC-type oligopeptide transport system ATPase subunit
VPDLVAVARLGKTFQLRHGGTVRAVDDVSFTLNPGQTVGLVGESGSGKSTLGRCLLRLYEPNDGVIAFDGTEIQGLSQHALRPYRRRMQMVFQDPLGSLNPAFTVGSTLTDALRQAGFPRRERRERALELLDAVGLDSRFLRRHPNEMSGGQSQRVGVARALASEPDFVFLDEPTSSLDLSVRGQIINLLADLQEERGLAYLFATHDLSTVRFLADTLIVLYQGRVVEMGPAVKVFAEPEHAYTRALLDAARLSGAGASRGPVDTDPQRRRR